MAVAPLILASASPRRRELLAQLGVEYICKPADIDETPYADESPDAYVRRMALEKAGAARRRHPDSGAWVLAADTTVVVDGAVLGKPQGKEDALRMLAVLSGRAHVVMTAVCLMGASAESTVLVKTRVQFIPLTRPECEAYLESGEAWDKAGAYGIQGLAGAFVAGIDGSYSNVVGLPLSETWQLLRDQGIRTALSPEIAPEAVDE